jgi:hypothetical protein
LSGDGEESIAPAIRLIKSMVSEFPDDCIGELLCLAPVLAFHSLAGVSPSVWALAQQALVLLAGSRTKIDKEIVDSFEWMDVDEIEVGDLADLIESCADNENAPASMLSVVVKRFKKDLGSEAIDSEKSVEELLSIVLEAKEKSEVIWELAALLTRMQNLSQEQRSEVLQVLADVSADEKIDMDEKKVLLIGLDLMRRGAGERHVVVPDPTPVSTTHNQEGFSKTQGN